MQLQELVGKQATQIASQSDQLAAQSDEAADADADAGLVASLEEADLIPDLIPEHRRRRRNKRDKISPAHFDRKAILVSLSPLWWLTDFEVFGNNSGVISGRVNSYSSSFSPRFSKIAKFLKIQPVLLVARGYVSLRNVDQKTTAPQQQYPLEQ